MVKSKLKKGSKEKWFEKVNHKIFTIYKAAILEYPLKVYKYIQLNWTGQGFSLGLSTNPRDGDHEYIDDDDWNYEDEISIESVYRDLENISSEDIEFKREEWPKEITDCYELEYFLINISLALAYIKLEKDKKVKKYLNNMEVITIVSSGRDLKPFTFHNPNDQTKKNVAITLVKNYRVRQLILDLWGKEAKNTGIAFLNHFERKVTKIKDMPKLTLKEAQEQAYDLKTRFRHEDALMVLRPVLENALNNNQIEDSVLLEKCCDIMGQVTKNSEDDYKESIYWFQKGLDFLPNGHSALSLMLMYKQNMRDRKALITFCEKHLQNIDLEDNVDHTYECYRFLGMGYVKEENREKALATYETLLDFLTRMDKTYWLDNVIRDLDMSSNLLRGYTIAYEIRTWLKLSDTN